MYRGAIPVDYSAWKVILVLSSAVGGSMENVALSVSPIFTQLQVNEECKGQSNFGSRAIHSITPQDVSPSPCMSFA